MCVFLLSDIITLFYKRQNSTTKQKNSTNFKQMFNVNYSSINGTCNTYERELCIWRFFRLKL